MKENSSAFTFNVFDMFSAEEMTGRYKSLGAPVHHMASLATPTFQGTDPNLGFLDTLPFLNP